MTNKSAPEEFPLAEIDLLVGWRAGEDEYLFTKAVAMVCEWLLDTRRIRIAFVTSLRRFWLKLTTGRKSPPRLALQLRLLAFRAKSLILFGQCIELISQKLAET